MDDYVIDFNHETFKNCLLKLAFRKIKYFKYNDVELNNASLDFVGYYYEYNILYIYIFVHTFIIYIISFEVYCQLFQNDAQYLLVYRYPSQFHGQIACTNISLFKARQPEFKIDFSQATLYCRVSNKIIFILI